MTQFPEPVPIPKEVPKAREKRHSHLLRAARWGVFIRLGVITIELMGVYSMGSSALLLDAISSSLDIACSLILMLFIKLAARPPDDNHPFGHGRYEPLAGLQLGLLMFLIGAGMILQQTFQIAHYESNGVINPWVWTIPFAATLLLEVCYQILSKVANNQHSTALAADALHFRIDALTSLLATVTLIIAAKLPGWSVLIDHGGAIVIALLMMGMGMIAARSNLHQLMDRTPDLNYFERVKQAAMKVEGVLETEKIRIQIYGPDAHVDIDVEVNPHLPVDIAHCISQQVRRKIQEEWPAVRDVTVHIEPYYPDDH